MYLWLQIRLTGNDGVPFTPSKQQSMLVATVSYLAALDISATQLRVVGGLPTSLIWMTDLCIWYLQISQSRSRSRMQATILTRLVHADFQEHSALVTLTPTVGPRLQGTPAPGEPAS